MTTFFAELRGINFRPIETQVYALNMSEGQDVSLEREPDNKYDENAIKVIAEDHFIGYVAKEVAEDLAPILDAGDSYHGFILDMANPKKPMLQIDLIDGENDAA